ncbi:MAG: flagellar hook-basal body complex protein FliE [Burkholderiales bacterium]|nr:flagellar hook-basal body complex protein FliE [Burkholderiales bacterium]
MDTKGIDQLLSQLQAASTQAAGNPVAPATGGPGDFAALLQSSLDQVSNAQTEAKKLAQALELGAPNVNVEDVIISLQKADVSFQTMVQVRNKLVEAYQQIMSMPV